MKKIFKIFAAAVICCVIPFVFAGCFDKTGDQAQAGNGGDGKAVKLTREEWEEAVKVVESATNYASEGMIYATNKDGEYELESKMEAKRDGNVIMSTTWRYDDNGVAQVAQRDCLVFKDSIVQWYLGDGVNWQRMPVDDYTMSVLKARFEYNSSVNGLPATIVYSAMVDGQKLEGDSLGEMYNAFTFDENTGKYSSDLSWYAVDANNVPIEMDVQLEVQIVLTIENGKVTKMDSIQVQTETYGKVKTVGTTTYGGVTITAPPEAD